MLNRFYTKLMQCLICFADGRGARNTFCRTGRINRRKGEGQQGTVKQRDGNTMREHIGQRRFFHDNILNDERVQANKNKLRSAILRRVSPATSLPPALFQRKNWSAALCNCP